MANILDHIRDTERYGTMLFDFNLIHNQRITGYVFEGMHITIRKEKGEIIQIQSHKDPDSDFKNLFFKYNNEQMPVRQIVYQTTKCDTCKKYIFVGEHIFRRFDNSENFISECKNCTPEPLTLI